MALGDENQGKGVEEKKKKEKLVTGKRMKSFSIY